MELAAYKYDVWGQEVLLGLRWDTLWLVVSVVFVLLAAHAIVMAARRRKAMPSKEGKRVSRHQGFDRLFHWVMAASTFVLLITGVLPILGVRFSWLNLHWIAGIILTVIIAVHIVRSIFWQDLKSMALTPKDVSAAIKAEKVPGKYSFAQKGMHLAMTIVIAGVIYTGIVLLLQIDTPWWDRTNAMAESQLGLMFFIHGISTLGLIVLTAAHIYFALRPEKLPYTRSMVKGWMSEDEVNTMHENWSPEEAK